MLLVFAVREPIRRDSFGNALDTSVAPKLQEVLNFARRQRSLIHITIGFALITVDANAIDFWTVSYFVRSHDLDILEAGGLVAAVWLVAGIPGTLLGGYLLDRLAKRDIRWHTWMISCVCLVTILPAPFIYLSPTIPTALAAVFVSTLIWSMWFAPQTTILTALVGSRSRAVAWATFSAVLLVVGQGFGPPLIGAISDLLEPRFGNHSLRYAMLAGVVFQAWGALHFYLAGRTLKDDYERASGH